ncbi:MAG: hypothetical protein HY566_01010 [Candidatus Kerfeldbacteria bacterium]|nr:hypothetical protein [Candidatus Kerfeldbacteria bacterium]
MIVYVFGNPDLPHDALPIRILDRLRTRFPGVRFEEKDPNEEWDVPEHLVVLDTVKGIEGVMVFRGLESFTSSPRVSMHDFDALTQLRFLQKLRKFKTVTVVGVSPELDERHAFHAVEEALQRLIAPETG